jgi:hypothetical protein
MHPRDVICFVARPGEQPVRCNDLVDRPDALRPAVSEDHKVVTDTHKVGEDVRREHDSELALSDSLDHRLQELAARERVKGGDWLVEQQQLRPLRERKRQRDLRALAT